MDDHSAARRFTREEAALILHRATEGEQRLATRLEDGLTLDEIARAAGDAGIDVAALRRAAAITHAPADPFQTWLVAAPVNPIVRGVFAGSVPPERHDAARLAVESAMGCKGELEVDATGFVWREEHGFGRTSIGAHATGSSVEVIGEAERRGHLLALMFGFATLVAVLLQPLGGFAGLAALSHPLLAVLAPVGAVLAGTRFVWPALQRPMIRRLESAVLDVGAVAGGSDPAKPGVGEGRLEESS